MQKIPIISADSHVNEPDNLWAERLPAKYRERAPRVVEEDGVVVRYIEGMRPRRNKKSGASTWEGEDLERMQSGGYDLAKRMKDQDRDGVVGEIIYPSMGLFIFLSPDQDFQMAQAKVYNDWLIEIFKAQPKRFAPVALIPIGNIPAAVAEVQRAVKTGHRGVSVPCQTGDKPAYNSPVYDPLWAAIQDAGVPVNFHAGTGHEPRDERGPGGAVINYLLQAQGDGPRIVSYLCASGVLERFSKLQFVTVETGSAWLAWILTHMDHIYQKHHMWVSPKLQMMPSEYCRRQGHVTFQDDPVGVVARQFTGVQTLMWGNDYPHHEGTWPHSQEAIASMFKDVPLEETKQIVNGNAAKLFRF